MLWNVGITVTITVTVTVTVTATVTVIVIASVIQQIFHTLSGIREGVRQALLPLWNSYYFFSLYANAANYAASPSYRPTHPLDRYILAKTKQLILEVADALEAFDSFRASALVREFCEILTNWYIRRSRDRFWLEDHDAFDTLYTLLEAVLRVSAPLLPIVSEEMWRGLTNGR